LPSSLAANQSEADWAISQGIPGVVKSKEGANSESRLCHRIPALLIPGSDKSPSAGSCGWETWAFGGASLHRFESHEFPIANRNHQRSPPWRRTHLRDETPHLGGVRHRIIGQMNRNSPVSGVMFSILS
jgi:hypothetical protein